MRFIIHKDDFSFDLGPGDHFKIQQKRRNLVPDNCLSSHARECDTEGSGYRQGNQKKEPGLSATSHLGPRHSWDGLTYMPCLSTCLSHSEPCENARPQNSHGKRFSVLRAAPRSENLIRSVKREQSVTCAPWE